jgi:peptidoglycan/xylan/chitin deacetylase (PgdA/CDA1 family)
VRRESKAWPYWRTVLGVCAGVTIVVVGCQTGNVAKADEVDCSKYKCVALTFDDGPSPYTDRLLKILQDNDAKATFFEIGNKVAANPDGAKRVVEAGMELGQHTWEHPNMTTIPPEFIAGQFSKAGDAIEKATGQRPKLVRTAGGLINDQVLAEARAWPTSTGTSSRSTGPTTPTPRPPATC